MPMSPVQAGGLRADSLFLTSLLPVLSPPPPPSSGSFLTPILSLIVSLSPHGTPRPPHVGHSLPGLFPFRLWGDSWAPWVMEANLGITREITGKTALRGAREGRREEGTWDTGDEGGEVCTRLPGTSGEPCPGSLLWDPPFLTP